jgi:hypothetical protein
MAGSLNHIIDENGQFDMSGIENMGDAHEALDECFKIIYTLAGGDMGKISAACRKFRIPDPFDPAFEDEIKPQMRLGGKDSL